MQGSLVSMDATMSLVIEFFAPLSRTSPRKGTPPSMVQVSVFMLAASPVMRNRGRVLAFRTQAADSVLVGDRGRPFVCCYERRATRDVYSGNRDVTHRYNQRRQISAGVWRLHGSVATLRPIDAPGGVYHMCTRSR